MSNELINKSTEDLSLSSTPLGFEDEEADDIIIPRVKVIQTLSPERKDKIAEEGDIINSLTHEKLNGKTFVPVLMFKNNIHWRDRSDGGGIQCIARDGKVGEASDGTRMACRACRKCEFDNSKQGRAAVPVCTQYINFLGFFSGEPAPIILSFSKTSMKEGKKLYSMAKLAMQNMWNFSYRLDAKLMAKGNNEWFIPVVSAAGATDETDRTFGLNIYKTFRNSVTTMDFDFDMDDNSSSSNAASAPVNTDTVEF